jgi:hypothetical protein
MPRSWLLTFIALVAAHAVVSVFAAYSAYQVLCSGGPERIAEGIFYPFFIPLVLLGQTGEDPPDLGSLVGVPVSSSLWPVLMVSVNSLLWVGCVYGVWLAGRWAWRKVAQPSGWLPNRSIDEPNGDKMTWGP